MMKRYSVLGLLLLAFFSTNAEASTLFGRVIEINDADVITVFNLNRPVRIRLLAVDAPEAGQAFGDVAKKHLSDLVYDKSVSVEYSGIAADGSLVGRVTMNGVDVGAQMIRDGAAWFDASNQDSLSGADREIYQQSEQAARSERRGLWQAENPIAPWEYVRAKTLRRSPAASLNSVLPAAKARRDGPAPELTNLTLLAARLAPASESPAPASSETGSTPAWTPAGPAKSWQQFKPTGENFSALVPEQGKQTKISVPIGDKSFDINVYAARDGWAIYGLMWVTGPTYGESDLVAIDSTVKEFIKGFGESYEKRHQSAFSCELQGERRFAANGFSGSDFDLPSCTIPAKVRAYTRVVGSERQMYIGAVFYVEEDANISRFLKSFTVGTAAAKAKRSATQ
jgi:endonuclease YncB( thermonuclease family)